jgi:hypothetical protein
MLMVRKRVSGKSVYYYLEHTIRKGKSRKNILVKPYLKILKN